MALFCSSSSSLFGESRRVVPLLQLRGNTLSSRELPREECGQVAVSVASSVRLESSVAAGAAVVEQRVAEKEPHVLAPPITKVSQSQGTQRKVTAEVSSPLEYGFRSNGNIFSAMCDMAETFINMVEPQERPLRSNPIIQLEGNFAPVDESSPQKVLEVVGTIPACMNGVYVRNGGNPKYMPTAGYHNFDGDGMLHVVKIKDGEATHCCRYTKTNRFLQEDSAGRSLFTRALGELSGLGGLARLALFQTRDSLGIVDRSKGIGSANAGLEYYNGMLLAMSEDDMPYAVHITDDGDVKTLGRYDFNGALKSAMTAHPRVDPKTGEMFSFSYDVMKEPYLTYFRATPEGKRGVEVPITLPEPMLIHDFAITENYAVFPDVQTVFRLQEMFIGKSPITVDENKVSRFGVIPRNARSEAKMKWFNLPGSTCFHYVNAWEEGDEVIIAGSVIMPLPYLFDRPQDLENRLTLFRLNLKTGEATKRQISNANLDVGKCNTLYTGKKTRYVYMSIAGPWPKYSGVAKVDLEVSSSVNPAHNAGLVSDSSIVGWRKYSSGCYGSEPFFVPRNNDPSIDEDDGYVVTHCHDENTGVSELLILDAQSRTLEPVASLKMPTRVPYGFHGIFLTEEELALQRLTLA